VNIVLCSLQVLKRREADVRKLGAILMVSTAVAIAAYSALAKDTKSTMSLAKKTATGKHYNTITLTPHKPKTPVTEQKASNNSGDTGSGPNDNPNSTGAGATKGPNNNPNSTGAGASKGPNNNPNSTGAGATKGPNNNPNSTGVGARGPKLTPDMAGVKNISR
jgi:hypothetical protein